MFEIITFNAVVVVVVFMFNTQAFSGKALTIISA